jgi:8-oxo-dGTP pyrophosphatase MutT (NUDIX family)
LIALFERQGEIFFPLIQRPEYTGIHSGQIGLPGGKIEDHDKDRDETALRETEEEIGIDSKNIRILGRLSELYVQASHYNVLPVVGYLPYIPEYKPDPTEVSRVIEASIKDLIVDEKRKVKELLIREKYNIIAPYFEINDEIVWGATAMILSEFSAILKEILN